MGLLAKNHICLQTILLHMMVCLDIKCRVCSNGCGSSQPMTDWTKLYTFGQYTVKNLTQIVLDECLEKHTNHNLAWQITVSVLLAGEGSGLFPTIHPFINNPSYNHKDSMICEKFTYRHAFMTCRFQKYGNCMGGKSGCLIDPMSVSTVIE